MRSTALFVEVKGSGRRGGSSGSSGKWKGGRIRRGCACVFRTSGQRGDGSDKDHVHIYVVLFGMMLSDAAYGLIVSVACFVLLKKYPRMSESMSKSLRMFMYCGISTLVWGILFGGYFGDVVDVVSGVFFGHEVSIPALWFIPLNDPMRLLIFSMLLGMIHLFTGLGIKGYMCIRDKRYLDFFCDVVLWYLLLIGLILMLLPSSLF